MTVIRPNSVSGINSITVQSGNSLAVHKANGELIRTLTSSSGVSTFSTLSVGTATTDNSAAKSINIGLGASIAQHNDNTLTFGTNGDPRITIDASGNFNVGSAATIKAGGNATFSGIVTAASFIGDGSGLTGAGPTLTGSTNNTIVTVTGANAIQGESNLTFDGSALAYSAGGAERFNLAHTSGGTVALKNPSNASMQFGTNDTTRMTITSSGGVGIGTESPDFEFTVADMSGAAVIRAKDGANSKIVDLIANSTGGLVRTIGSYPLVLNTNQTERLRIGPSGGVGISTDKIRNADFLHIATQSLDFTNPTEELMDGGGICFQTIDNLATTGKSFPGIFWAPNTNELGRARAGILGVAANNHDATDIVFLAKYLPGGDGIYPRDERMRITNGGRIGIGTDAPDHKFEVMDQGSSVATSRNGNNAQLLFKSNNVGQAGQFEVSESGGGGVMIFSTKTTGGTVTERMRLATDGNIGINRTNPSFKLDVNGTFKASGTVTLGGVVTFDGSYNQGNASSGISLFGSSASAKGVMVSPGTEYNFRPTVNNGVDLGTSGQRWKEVFSNNSFNSSDRNIKNTITDSDLGLSFINKLRPVSYKWIQKEEEDLDTKTHYGLIAQEIEDAVVSEGKTLNDFAGVFKPDAYKEDGTGEAMALAYGELISPLIKAVQELSAKVTALEGG